jgi:alkylation response protein AidB-like acyl-CoA dehydrogenase
MSPSAPWIDETDDHRSARRLGGAIDGGPQSLRDKWDAAAAFGLFELLIPPGPLPAHRVLAVLEGLGEGCRDHGFLLAVGAHSFGVGAPVARFGAASDADVLRGLRDGTVIAGLAATEAEAGSDVMALGTRYERSADGYVLRGEKRMIVNVADADAFLVLATRDPRQHFRGIAAFLVRRDTPGLIPAPDGARLDGCSIGTVTLDGVTVPHSALIGGPGRGAALFHHAMLWERVLMPAVLVGVLRRLFRDSQEHAKARRQFGRPIGANQYVAGRVVDLLSRYRSCSLLVREAVAKLAAGTLTMGEASLTKLVVSEATLASSVDALRLRGGHGLVGEAPALGDVDGALGSIVYSGTSDLQRVIIASELGIVG